MRSILPLLWASVAFAALLQQAAASFVSVTHVKTSSRSAARDGRDGGRDAPECNPETQQAADGYVVILGCVMADRMGQRLENEREWWSYGKQ